MNSSSIFLLFVIAVPLAMLFMHRGGHAHGGHAHSGMGGGCGGGSHGGHGGDAERAPEPAGEQEKKPLLGPPGTASNAPLPASAEEHRHRGC